mmetsp:Transcript_21328/g.54635  ORF Transcript_21328/g.54635 Transcript_21328/m.54635 type:complete len:227 (+) Transcript_21328:523-1203(+)
MPARGARHGRRALRAAELEEPGVRGGDRRARPEGQDPLPRARALHHQALRAARHVHGRPVCRAQLGHLLLRDRARARRVEQRAGALSDPGGAHPDQGGARAPRHRQVVRHSRRALRRRPERPARRARSDRRRLHPVHQAKRPPRAVRLRRVDGAAPAAHVRHGPGRQDDDGHVRRAPRLHGHRRRLGWRDRRRQVAAGRRVVARAARGRGADLQGVRCGDVGVRLR